MSETERGDGYEVVWFGKEVQLVIEGATADGLEAAAFDVESIAKQLIVQKDLVDTGFMMNSVYAVGVNKDSYGAAVAASGMNPDAGVLPKVDLETKLEAIVAVGAEYGIWPEIRFGYLYPALEAGAARAGGHIQLKAKEAGL